jgi:branched-chain amino acid transport system ATP-binding protein
MLEIRDLEAGYGQIQVLWNVNISVGEGEIVAMVGSNGAGKTTLLKTIAGLIRPRGGEITLNGEPVTRLTPDVRVKLGISLVPEGRQLFSGMTVEQNLMMGAYSRDNPKNEIARDLDRVFDLFPALRERSTQLAGTLSGGEQQMCAIGRALMADPKVLLIDELSLGLAPVIVDKLVLTLREINTRQGLTVFLVEQDVETALRLASRGYVLETGSITMHGDSKDLLDDERIKKSYLGI